MVYERSEVVRIVLRSEVDLNRSLWYRLIAGDGVSLIVLKLTSTGHYGIAFLRVPLPGRPF